MRHVTKLKQPLNKILTTIVVISTIINLLPISIAKAQEPTPTQTEPIQLLPPLDPATLDKPTTLAPTPQAESARLKPKPRVHQLQKKVFSSTEKITLVLDQIEPTDVTAKLTDFFGKERKIPINEFKKANFTVLEIDPSSSITPGKYTFTVTTDSGQTSSQDFSWGVLALNTNKSIFQPNEVAQIAIAVLDDAGEMVCDSSLKLKVTSEKLQINDELSTEAGSIKVNPECKSKDFTLKPDYETSYQTGEVGVYSLELTATTPNGTKNITDSFEVQPLPRFDVERITATRIYPPLPYPVKFNITANEDFKGKVTEVVPASFEVSANSNVQSFTSVETVPEKQIQTEAVLGTNLSLALPFHGDYPITTMFGEFEEDPLLQKKYEQNGVIGHDGVDFALPQDTPLYSVDDGVVVRATEDGDYGTTIVVEHSWGKSYYGHLSNIITSENTEVKKGILLGLSGNTGLSTGPHLHFGIKMATNDFQNGYFGKTDPLPLLGIEPASAVLGVQAPENSNVKVLSWELEMKKGESVTLGYKFKAPEISPQFYTLGPLKFENESGKPVFKEARTWQIAADAVVVTGGIVSSEAQFGGNQRKVAFVNSAWYAFYNDGTDVFYQKSSDGLTWNGAVNFDSAEDNDADNYNPSIDVSGNYIHVFWLDESADQVQGMRLDTTSDLTTQTTVCGLTSPGAFTVSTYMVSVASLSAARAVVAYGDTNGGANVDVFDVTVLDGVTCTVTDVSPGNVPFGTQGSGITGSVTSGNRPVLVGLDTTHAALVWRDNTNLKSAVFNAASADWTSPSVTIAANTDTTYSVTTDGTNVWALTKNSTTATLLYKCCTADINEQELDSDAGANDDATDSDIAIYCINSSDCKIAYTDDIDTAAPKLIFIDCGSNGAGGRDAAGDDPHCTTKATVTLDSDISQVASTAYVANPDIYCVTSANCKLVYGDLGGNNSPAYIFVDCADENCTQSTATFTTLSSDFGANADLPYISVDCVGGDTDCKVVLSDMGSNDDLSFLDCADAACTGPPTFVDIDAGAGEGATNELYCVAADNCKVIYYDVATTDVVFVNCGGAGTPATCTTLSGDTTILDSTVSGTEGAVDVDVDCVGGSTECRAVYIDDTDGDAVYVDCAASALCASPTQTDIDTTAGSGVIGSVSLSCISISDCKFSYVGDGTSGAENLYFVDCDADDVCVTGSAYSIPGARTKGDLWCVGAADCKLAYYDGTSAAQPTVQFGDCDTADCLPTWSTLTAPWTSETNVLSVSLTYDSTNVDLIANIIKDDNDKAYYSIADDVTTPSWATAVQYDGFTADTSDMDNMSSPETAAGTSAMGVFLRNASNLEFDLLAVAGPTLAETLRHGGWFSGGTEQPFTF